MTKVILKAGRRSREAQVTLGGVTLVFRQCYHGPHPAMACALPADADAAARVRDQIALMPAHYELVSESLITWAGPPVAGASSAPRPGAPLTPRGVALRRGWLEADLEGAGVGDQWDKLGGHSPRTGLTMVDMSLCVPPPEWAEKADDYYPWELAGWKPPGLDFKTPTAPSKRPPVDDEEVDDDDAPPVAVEVEEEEEAAVAEAPVSAAVQDLEEAFAEWGGSLPALRVLFDELTVGDVPPSINKLRYHLPKHELPKVTTAQYAALVG